MCVLAIACGSPKTDSAAKPAAASNVTQLSEVEQAARRQDDALDKEFPLHGLVTGLQLKVRLKPEPESTTVGWLRIGSRIRLAPGPTKTATCATGFYRVRPMGYACAGEGIEVAATPPPSEIVVNQAPKDAALPYTYYFVKDDKTPEYHRLPSRDEQREAVAFVERYFALKRDNETRAEKFWNEGLPNEPTRPNFVRAFLSRGFFVAGAGVETRAFRNFVRTVRGRYIKEAQLETRRGTTFQGVELNAQRTLPIAWMVREARPFRPVTRDDGSMRLVADPNEQPIARHTLLDWEKRERQGEVIFHRLRDGRYLKHWFAAVAERIDPPKGIKDDEPWVHVNLTEQTLVAYVGREPKYATLVSSGLDGHNTPEGVYTIRAKHVAATMSDIGADAEDDRYSIEDVPWTQYFEGSLALHGAFWHERFGLQRSHGCVNLTPLDAHYLFNFTWPPVPDGWHGTSTDRTGLKGSTVVITGRSRPSEEPAEMTATPAAPSTPAPASATKPAPATPSAAATPPPALPEEPTEPAPAPFGAPSAVQIRPVPAARR